MEEEQSTAKVVESGKAGQLLSLQRRGDTKDEYEQDQLLRKTLVVKAAETEALG